MQNDHTSLVPGYIYILWFKMTLLHDTLIDKRLKHKLAQSLSTQPGKSDEVHNVHL